MGHTLLLDLPQEVYESLVETAQKTGETLEALAVRLLTRTVQSFADDPLEPFIGAFKSDIPDWGDKHDEYLGQALWDEMHGTDEDT